MGTGQSVPSNVSKVFKEFDKNGDGIIMRDELEFVLKTIRNESSEIKEDDIEVVLQSADVNGDGKIDYEEFCHWMMKDGSAKDVLSDVEKAREARGAGRSLGMVARPSEWALCKDGDTFFAPSGIISWPKTDKTTGFLLKQHFWSFSGGDYTVKDSNGADVIKVLGKVLSVRDKMILVDPKTDEKICMLQSCFWTEKLLEGNGFQLFTYKPNKEGQESTETENGTPVYRYAIITNVVLPTGNNWGNQYNLIVYDGNDRKETPMYTAFTETWRWDWDQKINVFKGDQIKETGGKLAESELVAKIGMKNVDWFDNFFETSHLYGIEATTNIDPVLMICFAIAVDAMEDKKD